MPVQKEHKKYDRGTSLSIFSSDRLEDLLALAFALLIAMSVYLYD